MRSFLIINLFFPNLNYSQSSIKKVLSKLYQISPFVKRTEWKCGLKKVQLVFIPVLFDIFISIFRNKSNLIEMPKPFRPLNVGLLCRAGQPIISHTNGSQSASGAKQRSSLRQQGQFSDSHNAGTTGRLPQRRSKQFIYYF